MADYNEIKSPHTQEEVWSQERHPLENANWFSYITVSWLDCLVKKGMKNPLKEQDIWPLAKDDSVENVYSILMDHWKPETKLERIVWSAFRRRIVITFVLYGIYAITSLIQPIAVKSMMQYLEYQDETQVSTDLGISNGYVLAIVLFIVSTSSAIFMDFAGFYSSHIGVNLKAALSHMVYVKTLSLSSAAKTKFTSGEVVTMSSVDLERVCGAFNVAQWTFVSPVLLIAIYVMLGFQLNFVSAFVGGLVMALFIIFGFVTAGIIGRLRERMLEIQADRVKMTNEVLQGIRVVKFYAWEEPIQEKLQEIRLRELSCLKKYHNLHMINNVFLIVAPVISLAMSLMIYVASGHPLTVPVAFTALAYINVTRQPCGIFSIAVVSATDALASSRRLIEFFNSEETTSITSEPAIDSSPLVQISNGDFSWTNETSSLTLKNIELHVKRNSLTIIVGSVGCGKSSLLSAILGDIHRVRGTRQVAARFSYVKQQPWIQHDSVKENILFQSEYNELLYNKVISSCQLVHDLGKFPKGDATEIGERGINLSGGQKARISLARAVYHQEADLYLLDDPLSALDADVANSVFIECIQDLLSKKTVLLVLQ